MGTNRAARVLLSAVLVCLCLGVQPSQGATEKDLIRVWVGYHPGEGQTVRQLLEQKNARFHYAFEQLEAYVVTLPQAALAGLARNPSVAGIEEDLPVSFVRPVGEPSQDYYFDPGLYTKDSNGQMVPWGIDAVQAREVWDQNRDGKIDSSAPTGAGITVCLIDSGLFVAHEEFEELDITGGISQVDDDWTKDSTGHCTFITGILAAANNSLGVVGVTPGTLSLYLIKYTLNGVATTSSDLVAAIFHCMDNGANIINMSIGAYGTQGYKRKACDYAYSQGVLLVAAAGNDSSDKYLVPASYDSVISAGAVDLNNQVASFSNQNDQVELAAPGADIISTFHEININTLAVDQAIVYAWHIDYAAYGSAQGVLVDGGLCLEGGDWAGALVLCERGDIPFYEKVQFVENSGGAAVLIYNNEPGMLYQAALSEDGSISSEIIALTISQEDGQYLVANKLGSTGSVYSLFVPDASGYTMWAGTSFSTAHVTAVAALLWSSDPSLTNVEIRQAMQQSALDLGTPGRDVAYGFGLVQAASALEYLKNSPAPECSADGVCNPACSAGQDPDCYCGDGVCQGIESCQNCREDCVITNPSKGDLTCCGNGICEKREKAEQCPADCP